MARAAKLASGGLTSAPAAKTQTTSIPAPIKGWNTRDPLAEMDPLHAIIMDNWFPGTQEVKVRNGFTSWATGLPATCNTLLEYNGLTNVNKLFAAAGSSIYDVSSGGAVGAAVVSGQTNSKFQFINFGTTGGQYLWACNGVDTPVTYNGTAWSTAALTGMTGVPIWVANHQRRLFFGADQSLSFYYLPVLNIAGAASQFDLSSLFKRGGYLMGMITWTRDGGSGMNDLACFVTSEGEVAVYAGTDPSSSSNWSLQGVFRIGKPIGRRFWTKLGGDAVLITQDGFVPLSGILPIDRIGANTVSISDQINKTVNDSVINYGSNYGWQAMTYPKGQWLLFNVPVSSSVSHQYVFNVLTKAPCRFTGMNATCWANYNDYPFFASGTAIYKADNGTNDNGAAISSDAKQAFNYFGTPGRQKLFKMARPIFASTGNFTAALDLNTDFSDNIPSATPTFTSPGAAIWDSSTWDSASWSGDYNIAKDWQSVTGLGYNAALRIRVSSKDLSISWRSTDYVWETGGVL